MNIVKGQGLPDFVLMEKRQVGEAGFLENLKLRFDQKQIYTYIGEQVVAMNPFQNMPDLYNEDTRKSYLNKYMYEVQPHIYALADDTFRQLVKEQRPQCVIVTGESGAGKTEASKIFMQYLTAVSGVVHTEKGKTIKTKLLDSNPILESFGNAKTIRNDNSSRFGKYMEIQFDHTGGPCGGTIRQYLLEKSRVVTRADNERSFHIFYMLLSQSKLLGPLFLENDPSKYKFLSLSKCYKVDQWNDEREFREVSRALKTLNMSDGTTQATWRVLAAILLLGNLEFAEKVDDQNVAASACTNPELLEQVGNLLELNPANLSIALTSRTINSGVGRRKSTILVPLKREEAIDSRDSLAKALYNKLFDMVVDTLNVAIRNTETAVMSVIGILDIYGFEIFEHNSFEQFCINYCNEKLQQLFIHLVLESEQLEYEREGIAWTNIDYFDNAPIVKLLEGKPIGIYKLLDQTCTVGAANGEALLNCLNDNVGKHDFFASYQTDRTLGREVFRIKHYAGVVDYEVSEFVAKNRDTLYRDLKILLASSTDIVVKEFYLKESTEDSNKRPPTAGFQFTNNVQLLVDKLSACEPHYIRCIKSNDKKAPFHFDEERIRHQCRYLNLVETVRVRKAGFCSRQVYNRFLHRYKMCCAETWPVWKGTDSDGTHAIMEALKIGANEYQMGKTKLFVRDAQTLYKLEGAREQHMPKVAIMVQRLYRGYKARKWLARLKLAQYMQALYRAYLARTEFKEYKAAVTIQRMMKGFTTRKYIKANRAKIIEERERARREFAAKKIQRNWFKILEFRWIRHQMHLFRNVSSKFGRDIQFTPVPRRSPQMAEAIPGLLKMQRAYWAHKTIVSVDDNSRAAVKQKIATWRLFGLGSRGKKAWSLGRRFEGDYMNVPTNQGRAVYQGAIKMLFQTHGDKDIAFADVCGKVNKRFKTQSQVVVVTDRNIYKYQPEKFKMIKVATPINSIASISVSPYSDTFIFIKMKPESKCRDMVLDLGVNGAERWAELATVIVEQLAGLGQACPVHIEDSIQFNNSRDQKHGGAEIACVFVADPNPPVPGRCYLTAKGKAATVHFHQKTSM